MNLKQEWETILLTLWTPQKGSGSGGRRTHTYVDTLLRDTDTNENELSSLMADLGCC